MFKEHFGRNLLKQPGILFKNGVLMRPAWYDTLNCLLQRAFLTHASEQMGYIRMTNTRTVINMLSYLNNDLILFVLKKLSY